MGSYLPHLRRALFRPLQIKRLSAYFPTSIRKMFQKVISACLYEYLRWFDKKLVITVNQARKATAIEWRELGQQQNSSKEWPRNLRKWQKQRLAKKLSERHTMASKRLPLETPGSNPLRESTRRRRRSLWARGMTSKRRATNRTVKT
ncbi:hypothetical protein RHMOL_Rhmol04G0019400 [Rhododendron molle]|uniref:Uncharacterized protein n=1 Tax=Rhododendron molle TaxID=49168 RepID=A0ACC0NWB5_RHOML|nr:hypothetical protein RHMOL_Rhmol04G0019400 [Rhododendron molle]